jgi:hypothetical protein
MLPSPAPEAMRDAVQSFLADSSRPAILDFGDKPIRLLKGQYFLEIRSGKFTVEVWDQERSLCRRILSLDKQSTGVLDCTVQRFGGATGKLAFLDLDKPQSSVRWSNGSRQSFGETFRRMLQRQFPGWEITALSSAKDLRRSFSATFPRAQLSKGNQRWATLACPSHQEESAFLSSALIWLDYLRKRCGPTRQTGLCLFLPQTAGNMTAQRLRWLTGEELQTRIFRFNEHGMAGEVDPQDLGNLDTRLTGQYVPARLSADLKLLLGRLQTIKGVGCCPELGGAISIRFQGLEFARIENTRISLGLHLKENIEPANAERVVDFAFHLSMLRSAAAGKNSELPVFEERWFESAVRSQVHILDPDLLPSPVHGQVLTFAGGERELVDLLAISSTGRLAVVELKTSEDIHLPMQGLDYWMRIGWHAERGELSGLFPATGISKKRPKLLLVAPALAFHPTNEIVLRYFSSDIQVERIGVNSEWESSLKVVFRLRGAEVPISHRGLDEIGRIDQYQKGN